MRPVYLKMKAFGPYAEETMVDFNELGTGIYLISGDTGAGKTTIFDGIVYGLFGESSGDKREGEMMHCDFCSKDEPMVVELLFEHQKKEYLVKRTIRFRKKRGTDSYGSVEQLAELIENGEVAVNKSVAVTKRIEEIIGLNADQFRKIVMLAQGEFKAFLEADEKSRNQILGKLFDNRPYVYFETQFAKACEELSNRSQAARTKIDNFLASPAFVLPPELSLEEKAGFQSTHPEFLNHLESLVAQDEEKREALEKTILQENQILDEIKKEESTVAMQNKQLALLEAALTKKQELEEASTKMTQLATDLADMEKAFYTVLPIEQKKNAAKAVLMDAQKKQDEYRIQKDNLEKEMERLEQQKEAYRDYPERIAAASHTIKNISDSLLQYEKLEKQQAERKEVVTGLSKAQEELRKLSNEAEELQEKQRAVKEELTNLSFVETEYLTTMQRYDEAKNRREGLFGSDGLKEQIKKGILLEQKLQEAMKNSAEANEAANKAEQAYRQLYKAFLDGQSVMLGKELESMIEQDGEAQCPVCHTRLKTFHMDLAEMTYPNREELAAAEQNKNEANQRFVACDGEQKVLFTRLENQKEQVNKRIEEFQEFFANQDYDSLKDGKLLKQVSDDMDTELTTLKETVLFLKKKVERQKECNTLLPQYEKTLEGKGKEVEEKKHLLQSFTTKMASLDAAMEEIQNSLPFANKQEALTKKEALEKEKSELEKAMQELTKELHEHTEKLTSLLGQIKENESHLLTFEKDLKEVEKEWITVLEKVQFSGEEQYRNILAKLSGMEGETWIRKSRMELEEHNQSKIRNAQEIETLTNQTKEYTKTDISLILQKKQEQIKKCEALLKEKESLLSISTGHENALDIARDSFGQMEALQKAYLRLSKLSNIANGVRTEGGRKSFDAYVMLHSFDEILEMANVHLDHMSGGKYMLVRQDKGNRKDSIAGMNIDVIDAFTGEQRKTATLSGGESFQVSMALALGLSSVVQAHSGNTRIDATFIDEGFGSLDEKVLDKAIEVLTHLAGESNQIGIISHVAKLEESIPKKILVTGSEKGSSLKIIQ